MTKQINDDKEKSPAEGEPNKFAWSKRARIVCSLLILFHIVAVFVAPFSGPPPSSIFGRRLGMLFSPYLRSLYIYNGYRFFAPNPGPSHLLRYEIDSKSGENIEGRFPDLQDQWPRLLYHRHLMLSETLFQLNTAIPSPEEFAAQQQEMRELVDRLREEQHFDLADELETSRVDQLAEYTRLQQQQQLLLDAIGNNLLRQHDAESVRLYLAERPLPLPDVIQEALQDRASGAEPVDTRSLPILIADDSRWIERQVWPEQAPVPGNELIPSPSNDDEAAHAPFLLQRIPEHVDGKHDGNSVSQEQGRAGE